jgi:hypothetical protein
MLSGPAVAVTDTKCFAFSVRGSDVPKDTNPNGKGKVVCHTFDPNLNLKEFGESNQKAKYVLTQQLYNNPCAIGYGSQADVFACGPNGSLWRSHYDGSNWTNLDELV